MNKKYACFNIMINITLLSLMIFFVKTSNKSYSNKSCLDKSCVNINNDKNTNYFLPYGDWQVNTISYKLLTDNILCGVIKTSNIFNEINLNRLYNNDCIKFRKNDFITTYKGKFKIMNL